jgi:hypothetical protein
MPKLVIPWLAKVMWMIVKNLLQTRIPSCMLRMAKTYKRQVMRYRGKNLLQTRIPLCMLRMAKTYKRADDEIQRLNELGLGEDISSDEFLEYFNQLPNQPNVHTYAKVDDENLTPLYERHARYRIRYLKVPPVTVFISHKKSRIIYICVPSAVYNVMCYNISTVVSKRR